ncbi:hypothetical protein Poli38472_013814 [Pythium oligandrum]|uniref:glucan endo-1,3-beta-D-glucosidase n=1 Tax=Pythium oligandrum TaxID=41045 RepID=A0A8K1FD07_PYTOL|nr:hypothetical protein Poli38472_013814 [Pythium oligandrum]|eukprot:TMW55052.1 hypothetical protein Poli38472_013814 [Pythium oligandrum]
MKLVRAVAILAGLIAVQGQVFAQGGDDGFMDARQVGKVRPGGPVADDADVTPAPKPTPAVTGASRAPAPVPTPAPVPSAAPSVAPTAVPSAAPSVAPTGAPSATPSKAPTPSGAPSPAGNMFKPFSTEKPSDLFKPNDGLAKLAPIVNVKADLLTTRPIPTNEWWGNLIHTTNKERGISSNPAWANPYALKLPVGKAPFGIQACYSYTYRRKAELKDDRIKFYLHEYHNDVTLSATEFAAVPSYEVYDWSDLGINLRVCAPGGGKCMDSALVNGMSFISATYDGLTPRVVTEANVTKLEESNGKFVITMDNKQTWVLYAKGAKFTVEGDKKAVVASGAFTGMVRLAILPDGAAADVYDSYAGCAVRGGMVSVQSRTDYSLDWEADGETCASNGLLHFAFQHHLDSMGIESGDAKAADGSVILQSSVRGPMRGIVTKSSGETASWKLKEPELAEDIGFYAPRKIDAAIVEQVQLKKKLKEDIDSEWKIDGTSYYFSGKAYQKYASLCLMADDVAVMGADKTLLRTCLDKLEKTLDSFLTNKFVSPLAYDSTYRGIVTSEVFTKNDVNVDFGNGIYNDHHYHYGYWITASAMLKKLDPEWKRMGELDTMVWTMLRDVANPSQDDTYFPTFRHFSWFLGHSYSHGATPLADGKDQESTSEDINFFYGMMLWGKVNGNKAVEDLGSLMLRIDARAVRTYFLMDSSNKVHPPEFVKNHVTGIFFDNKVDYATWFSAEKHCIHGIQMIPVSPINEIVRSPKFVKEEWDDVLSKETIVKTSDPTNAWLSLLYANYAVVDKQTALKALETVKMDDGLTRSWALYVAATRPSAAA